MARAPRKFSRYNLPTKLQPGWFLAVSHGIFWGFRGYSNSSNLSSVRFSESMRNRKSIFFALPLGLLMALALLIVTSGGHAAAPERAHVTILATTDRHGHIDPIDYYTNRPENSGLAKAATIIKQTRKTEPNLLLLDSGDTIQGTPLVYYHNERNNAPIDPMMLVMNELKYDSMAVGNHEYNF